MDLSYATIPVFGTLRRLYRENRMAYMISNRENPENHPIYSIDTDMGSSMLLMRLDLKRMSLSPLTVEAANQTTKVQKQTWTVGLMMRLQWKISAMAGGA